MKLTRRRFHQSLLSVPLFASSLTSSILSGCDENSDQFRIGILLPKSGVSAQMGFSCERAVAISHDVFSGLGLDLNITVVDTESNPNTGRLKAEKLIKQGYNLLIGAFDSSVTAAIAEVCEQRKVPFLIHIAAADRITEQGYKYVFRNFPKAMDLVKGALVYFEDLTKLYNLKTVSIMAIQDTHGQNMVKNLTTYLKNKNLQLLDVVTYDPHAKDLSAEIMRLKKNNPDVVMPICRMNDAILMVRESVKKNFQPKLFFNPGSSGMYEKQFFRNLGPYAENFITATAWQNPRTRFCQKAKTIFLKTYPHEQFDMNAAFTLEAIYIAAMAYKNAESDDGEALTESLRKTHLTNRFTYGKEIAFDEKGQAKDIRTLCLQNQNGEPLIVLPEDMQQSKPIIPMTRWN